MQKLSIVGNGPLSLEQKIQIEESDKIFRFNHPPASHLDSRPRTDTLVLSNSSKQTRILLKSNDYLEGPVFKQAQSILLPYHPNIISKYMPKPNPLSRLKGARADWTGLCISKANLFGKHWAIINECIYYKACKSIGIAENAIKKKFPSSGILTVLACIDYYSDSTKIEIYGFGFEGWKRHDWGGECRHIKELAAKGIITINI